MLDFPQAIPVARFGHPVGMYFPRDSAEEVVVKDHACSQLAFFEIAVAP
jgi:hypothetical protein